MGLALGLLSVLLALFGRGGAALATTTTLLSSLIIAITLIVHLTHAKGNLLDTLTGNSDTSRSVALLIRDGED